MAANKELSPPFLLMSDIVRDIKLVDNPQDWVELSCLRKEAYDCEEKGDLIVAGLTLYWRAGHEDDPDLQPRLCIGATRFVLDSVGSEIDEVMAECYGRDIRLCASIYTVDGSVVVFCVSFVARHDSSDFRSYYLVYDFILSALFLLPQELPKFTAVCSRFPLKVWDEEEDIYSLVIMSANAEHPCPFFMTWTPHPMARGTSLVKSRYDYRGWVRKHGSICDDARLFQATVLFLYKGFAVWGDLGRGIMCCHCSELIYPGKKDIGKFKYFPPHLRDRSCDAPFAVYRNMGCVGDSIWSVFIEPSQDCPGKTLVSVWTLDSMSMEAEWKPLYEFSMNTFWELDSWIDSGLPETIPKYPILRQQDDGILYMLLPERSSGSYAHLVGIDLNWMCVKVNRRVSIPWMRRPIVLDPDFFSPHDMTI